MNTLAKLIGGLFVVLMAMAGGLLVALALGFIGAAIIKLLWWLCGMEAWLGLALPWGPAYFIAVVVARTGASTATEKAPSVKLPGATKPSVRGRWA